MNGAFINLFKFRKLMHEPSSPSKTDLLWLIDGQLFV